MRGLIWIIVLFAVAVAIAMGASLYNGNVYVVVEQTMLRINLHAFILGLLALVVPLGAAAGLDVGDAIGPVGGDCQP